MFAAPQKRNLSEEERGNEDYIDAIGDDGADDVSARGVALACAV